MEIPTINIDNYGTDNQLKLLVVYDKIVFKFRITPQYKLDFFAYGVTGNGKKMTEPVKLEVSPTLPPLPITKDIYLGNLEISNKSGFKELKDIAKDGTYRYIQIQPIAIDEFEVIYEIFGGQVAFLPTPLTRVKLNPSPPYEG